MSKRRKESWEKDIIPYTDPAFRPYVTALGQLALAWNGLHSSLAVLFCSVMGGGSIDQYLAVWSSITNDRMQRDMLLAAAKNPACCAAQDFPKLVETIEHILGQANDLEDRRNNALHAPLVGLRNYKPKPLIIPIIGHRNKRALRLWDKDLLKEFRYCRDYCVILRDFVVELEWALRSQRNAWPDTPKRPNRGDSNHKKHPLPKNKAKLPRPPKSSPG